MSAGKTILLRIRPENSSYSIEIHSPQQEVFGPYSIRMTREQLSNRNQALKERLEQVARSIGSRLDLTKSEMEQKLRVIAREGVNAFEEIFAHEDARRCITALLGQESVNTIKIWAEEFSLPWQLICPSPPRQSTDGAWSRPRMWGERYLIQRGFPINRLEDSRKQMKVIWISQPRVALAALRRLQHVSEEMDYLYSLKREGIIRLNLLRKLEREDRESEMQVLAEFLQQRCDITHIACHMRPHRIASKSSLVISTDFSFCPDDFRGFGITLKGEPLIILNACGTGIRNPLQTADFVSVMLKYAKAKGVMATECDVPSRFAAAFVQKFYEKLFEDLSVGRALMETRRHFMAPAHYNPLGLLYALYQLDPGFRFVRREISPS